MYINLLLMGAGGNISWWRNHPLPTAALSTPCPEGGVGKENMGTTGSFVSGTGDIGFDTLPEHCVTQAICSGISNLPLGLLHAKLEHIACMWVAPAPCSGCPSFSRGSDQLGLPALTMQVVQDKASHKLPSEKLALLKALSHCEWGGEKKAWKLWGQA